MMKGKIDQAKGRVKEAVGDLTGNEKLEAEGKIDQAKGKVKEVVEDAGKAVDEAAKKIKDKRK